MTSNLSNILRCTCICLLLAGCAGQTQLPLVASPVAGKQVCDSFLIYDMCIRDDVGNGSADYVYFSDTMEIFMYRGEVEKQAKEAMAFHPCAAEMNAKLTELATILLYDDQLKLMQELGVKRRLLSNYLAERNKVNDCNTSHGRGTAAAEEDDFFDIYDTEW